MDNNHSDPDTDLLAELRNDTFDTATWERFINRIAGWIRCHFPNLHREIDDLAGEAAVIAYRNLGQFRGESRFFRWVLQIARRVVYAHFRKHKIALVAFDDLLEEPPGDDDTKIAWKRLVAMEALNTLTEQERQVYIWRARDDLDHREIAQQLNISENASRLTWTRAAGKIGQFIRDNDP